MYLFNAGKKQRNRKRSVRHKAKLKAKNRRRRASIKAGK
jgi:hypothetical protein